MSSLRLSWAVLSLLLLHALSDSGGVPGAQEDHNLRSSGGDADNENRMLLEEKVDATEATRHLMAVAGQGVEKVQGDVEGEDCDGDGCSLLRGLEAAAAAAGGGRSLTGTSEQVGPRALLSDPGSLAGALMFEVQGFSVVMIAATGLALILIGAILFYVFYSRSRGQGQGGGVLGWMLGTNKSAENGGPAVTPHQSGSGRDTCEVSSVTSPSESTHDIERIADDRLLDVAVPDEHPVESIAKSTLKPAVPSMPSSHSAGLPGATERELVNLVRSLSDAELKDMDLDGAGDGEREGAQGSSSSSSSAEGGTSSEWGPSRDPPSLLVAFEQIGSDTPLSLPSTGILTAASPSKSPNVKTLKLPPRPLTKHNKHFRRPLAHRPPPKSPPGPDRENAPLHATWSLRGPYARFQHPPTFNKIVARPPASKPLRFYGTALTPLVELPTPSSTGRHGGGDGPGAGVAEILQMHANGSGGGILAERRYSQ
uniref:Uncharacterized protein n=1 Tax=Chromera velia CCMP2878 TaxID=1169474 RepID=A0A0G4GAQ3_9ALVE|eukprot:Cvel_4443.t1-p1 / transcript=Cvel_4443.t1 / gene=Cvel_4443 / organism=Chromera_velia_CCMP2878 / gene_product=hypothetical protein / transcript_product=hypothetical protein / location=Cvel_scaffold193:100901-103022(+) / protein_length=481 / sequence_SO=supercontig / SO=protein_coding / is_pseudo=false